MAAASAAKPIATDRILDIHARADHDVYAPPEHRSALRSSPAGANSRSELGRDGNQGTSDPVGDQCDGWGNRDSCMSRSGCFHVRVAALLVPASIVNGVPPSVPEGDTKTGVGHHGHTRVVRQARTRLRLHERFDIHLARNPERHGSNVEGED